MTENKIRKKHHRLNYQDRMYIQQGIARREGVSAIAKVIGSSREAIYKEIERGSIDGVYSAEYAQKRLYIKQ